MRQPSIAIISRTTPGFSGGAEKGLRHRGQLLSSPPFNIVFDFFCVNRLCEERSGMRLRFFPANSTQNSLKNAVRSIYSKILGRRKQYDILHLNNFIGRCSTPADKNLRLLQFSALEKIISHTHTKILYDCRGGEISYSPTFLSQQSPIFERFHFFTALNDDIHAQLLKVGIPENRILPVPTGIDVPTLILSARRVQEERQKLGVPSDRIVIVMMGSLNEKNLWELRVNVIKHLKSMPIFPIFVAGKRSNDDNLRLNQLQHLLRQIQIPYLLTGHVQDVSKYLKVSDILFHLSKSEGKSRAVAEAMSWGLPIIGFKVPGMTDLVIDGTSGWLFECHTDCTSIIQRIREILINRNKIKKAGQKARESAKEWSFFREAATYATIYQKMLTDSNNTPANSL